MKNLQSKTIKNAPNYRVLENGVVENIKTGKPVKPAKGVVTLSVEGKRLRFKTEDLVNETLDHIKVALKDAGLDKGEIQEVIMVGGSTRLPKANAVGAPPNKPTPSVYPGNNCPLFSE